MIWGEYSWYMLHVCHTAYGRFRWTEYGFDLSALNGSMPVFPKQGLNGMVHEMVYIEYQRRFADLKQVIISQCWENNLKNTLLRSTEIFFSPILNDHFSFPTYSWEVWMNTNWLLVLWTDIIKTWFSQGLTATIGPGSEYCATNQPAYNYSYKGVQWLEFYAPLRPS